MKVFAHPRLTPAWIALLFLSSFAIHEFTFAQEGIDCGCSKKGAFLGSDEGSGVEISQDTLSPGGKYRVDVSGTGPYDIQVRRVSDNSLRYSTNLANGYWGFSPDDERFLYHYVLGGVHNVVLIDLSVTPAQQRWSTSVATSSSRVLFSPYGDYVLYAALTSATHTLLDIVEARTGTMAYTTAFDFTVGGSGDSWGMADWGFSPDTLSRTFVYAFVTGQSSVQWQMINLKSRTKILDFTLTGISSFWQFSPCGDVLGLVNQTSPSFIDVTLYGTQKFQAALYSATLSLDSPIEFRTTVSSHIVKVGTTDYIMNANSAEAVCTIEPISLRLDPDSVVGGLTSTGTVVLNNPAASGGRVITLSSSNTGAATVSPTFTIPEGDTSGTFTVQSLSVSSSTNAVISGTAGGVTRRDTLTILPISVKSFTLSSPTVLGGDSISGTVTLSNPAGPGGKLVTFPNDNPSIVTMPGPILIAQGFQSRVIAIHTIPVAALDSAHVSASAGGVTVTNTLLILPFPTIRMARDTVVGGKDVDVIATLPAPSPVGGVSIVLESSVDSVAHPFSPGQIYEGNTQGSVFVSTAAVSTNVSVTFTATNAPFPTATTLLVVPANLATFTARPEMGCIVGEQAGFQKKYIAGHAILFAITLDGSVPAGGAHVALSVDKPGIFIQIDSADVPEYANHVSFTVFSSDVIAVPEQVIVSATYRSVTLYDTVTVVPAIKYSFFSVHEATESFSIPIDLNNRGEVLVSTPSGCYIWRNGVRTPSPCGAAFNDSGWIVATTYPVYGRGSVVVYKPDDTIHIPAPDSVYSHNVAVDINNKGQVAMNSSAMIPPYGPTKLTIWENNTFTYSGALDPYSMNALEMNDSGNVAGWVDGSGTGLPTPLPFVFNGGLPTIVTFPPQVPNILGTSRGINNHGTIVGSYYQNTGDPAFYHPSWFMSDNGAVSFVPPLPPWNRAAAFDIGEDGTVVGVVGNSDAYNNPAAFLYKDGLTYDLNCLAPAPPGWTYSWATKINRSGDILGFTQSLSGVLRAFLLKPQTVTDVRIPPVQHSDVPTSYKLSQNYPNPFNPVTTISYSLPGQSYVTLTISNILGQEVARLVDKVQAAGFYEVRWDAGSAPSGIYFYRLKAGTMDETRKLVVMK